MKSLIIGTRGSPLALAQVEIIRGLLQKACPVLPVEKKIITTSGDNFTNLSLTAGGGKGLFTKEIEDQLLRGEIHVAVHSLKDLPTDLPGGLVLAATPKREDVRDVLIYRSVENLTHHASRITQTIRGRGREGRTRMIAARTSTNRSWNLVPWSARHAIRCAGFVR